MEYDRKRVCVDEIRTFRPDGTPMRLLVSWDGLGYGNPSIGAVEPIPITPALLKELGFEWRKDSSCWRKYRNYDGEHYDWGIYAFSNQTSKEWCFDLSLPDFKRPRLYAKHLHEIEGQLAYYGVELIK